MCVRAFDLHLDSSFGRQHHNKSYCSHACFHRIFSIDRMPAHRRDWQFRRLRLLLFSGIFVIVACRQSTAKGMRNLHTMCVISILPVWFRRWHSVPISTVFPSAKTIFPWKIRCSRLVLIWIFPRRFRWNFSESIDIDGFRYGLKILLRCFVDDDRSQSNPSAPDDIFFSLVHRFAHSTQRHSTQHICIFSGSVFGCCSINVTFHRRTKRWNSLGYMSLIRHKPNGKMVYRAYLDFLSTLRIFIKSEK